MPSGLQVLVQFLRTRVKWSAEKSIRGEVGSRKIWWLLQTSLEKINYKSYFLVESFQDWLGWQWRALLLRGYSMYLNHSLHCTAERSLSFCHLLHPDLHVIVQVWPSKEFSCQQCRVLVLILSGQYLYSWTFPVLREKLSHGNTMIPDIGYAMLNIIFKKGHTTAYYGPLQALRGCVLGLSTSTLQWQHIWYNHPVESRHYLNIIYEQLKSTINNVITISVIHCWTQLQVQLIARLIH